METRKKSGTMLPFLALIKKSAVDAMDVVISRSTFKVRLDNIKPLLFYVNELGKKLDTIIAHFKNTVPMEDELLKLRLGVGADAKNLASKNIYKVELQDKDTTDKSLTLINEKLESLLKVMDDMTQVGSKGSSASETMAKKLDDVKSAIQQVRLQIPATQTVKVQNPTEFPIDEITSALSDIEKSIKSLKLNVTVPKQKDVVIPPYPTEMNLVGIGTIVEQLIQLKDSIEALPSQIPQQQLPTRMAVDIITEPPHKYPLPVTNININPLRGYAVSSSVTLNQTPKGLPTTVVNYRRSMIVYNNSSSTVYIGGSNVTTSNGLPVPANSYSPALDAGPKLIVYGVVASGTADVRVLELSNENIGG